MATISPDGVWQDMRGVRIKSGDLATMDADGFVRVTGRTKDLIIRGGVNIAPVEIDNVLLQNQSVSEAAAVGVPDRIYGEEVVAYVVAKAGARVTAEEIAAHCAARLPPFKTPKRIYVVDRLPRSDRGKVIRDSLREQWLKENGSG
jgi:acyl-CoA synthetase (AMP-forming)/AMP-acid ligase II